MDNSNYSRNRHNDHLGVNKLGKNIRKSPIHQPNFANTKQQPQPQVYNINKNDFRNIVQQLTGSPSQEPPLMGPLPQNPPKPPSLRLQRIRPPPLSPIARPPIRPPGPSAFNYTDPRLINPVPISPLYRPAPPSAGPNWPNTAESPISAYMRYLQNSIMDSGGRQSPWGSQTHSTSSTGILSTPPAPAFPSPQGNGPALLPSPNSQSWTPTSFMNLLSPRSPYPLLSPGFQYPPLLTPNFAFPSPGILGPGPQPPPSPGLMFPQSPSGFLPLLSPRWRD